MKLSSYSEAFISGLAFFAPSRCPDKSYFRWLKQSGMEYNCVTDMSENSRDTVTFLRQEFYGDEMQQ